MARPAVTAIPVFKLYGETTAWPTPDLIHCESIPERSKMHEWEIKPHRHGDLVQLLYVQSGKAMLKVEDMVSEVQTPSLQVVPALSVHTFRFAEDIQGHILSLARPLVEQLETALDITAMSTARCYSLGADSHYVDTLFSAIAREYRQPGAGRDLMLHSLINVLVVWLSRRCSAHAGEETHSPDRGREHLQAFMHQLEASFREHWSIDQHAQAMGLSAAHLNALCRRLCNQSALQIISQRLLLEAKRNLIYTTMTINQVSDSLGFSEPAYFSRFFKRATGQSPREFRQQK
ncbi:MULTISPECIES: helix-turn-helix domain-containing protein [Pseudomonas syringae group]|uniref:helix-turn-helix domain-containing protein n=1 Tax=Pseudomonas syringae group TaxID=136849 RepID=UPI0006D6143A|nr:MULTISPECIES: helix-turn-helix domain-containing protein [Pseudomonas syringae group]KPX32646.1 Transcriptional regulator PobR [Pseudomonas coronafaciens pv. garcae]MCQ2991382.1 helix-turn-helix domain-containing protein [Pseudomonas tremae]RMS88204.1 Transcriptional regulator PobR [Pseudomonas coronafaciens pv. oryzae]RMS97465.1 Transcriptional regulator PobR [Pseudomonas coronafaciens pv. oryzae]RMV84869.1 Transcriptional regulator PobR [Pseudomonas coronafaciens pv. garcae]